MTFKAMKFDTYKSSNSEIQKALKKLGYGWTGYADAPNHFHELARFLWTDIEGRITHSNNENYFLNEETQEYFLYDLLDFVQENFTKELAKLDKESYSNLFKKALVQAKEVEAADKFIGVSESIAKDAPILKETNPKDAIGSSKLPLNLVPDSLLIYASTAFAEGGSKYSPYNWRVAGVRASVYKAAHDRHMSKWWNGEDCDQATGVKHLASAIACLGIILDAELLGKLNDDRPPYAPIATLMEECEKVVKHVREMHKDCVLKEYRLADYPKEG
jgi:hypothetical protein